MDRGAGLGGGLGGLPTPWMVLRVERTAPRLCPHSSDAAGGVLVFLCLLVHNVPQLPTYRVIFSLLYFLCILPP